MAVIDSFYIAWKYVLFNKFKSVILVTCITLIAFLPLSLELLLNESEKQLMARAVSTPLLAGKAQRPGRSQARWLIPPKESLHP